MATLAAVLVTAVVVPVSPVAAAISCPSGVLSQPKGNQLFLYFPTTADSTFPSYNGNLGSTGATSPLADFDIADLGTGTAMGTTTALRDRIFEFVTDDYCEFNVRVQQTTTSPSPPEPRWQVVGLGTDAATSSTGGNLFGLAQDVDTDDVDGQDFARLWADSFDQAYGGSGGALNGTNSTLARWATAIGETAAHEAAHNYGAAHGHSAPRPGSAEDAQNNHIMATGNTGLTGETRASRDRHFSDTEYEILGHNIGLNVKTLHNWDFVNPNDTSANGMRIRLLSSATTLNIGWSYTGSRSPWQNPTVTNTGTTQTFQGTTYNVFNLDFTTAKTWDGPTAGVVAAGAEFHTGASFTGTDPVIVTRVQLLNGASALPLAPRLPGYDAGTADLDSGDFDLSFFNSDPAAGDLIIRDIEIRSLPRMLDINSMVPDARLTDIRGEPIDSIAGRESEQLNVKDRASVRLGNLTDKRSVDIRYTAKDCPPGSTGSGTSRTGANAPTTQGNGDTDTGEEVYCLRGNALSLFPATYTYVVATVVEPNAKHWDANKNQFVTGPLETKLFYQMGGIVPDFDKNGVDDLIDIRQGDQPDENENGVIDSVEPDGGEESETPGVSWWWLLILIVLLVVILLLGFVHRHRGHASSSSA